MRKIKEMGIKEFVRRLKNMMDENEDSKFVFFIGAGCSVSSGIPAAGNLVKQWLPKLKKLQKGDEIEYEVWLKENYPKFKENNASKFYGKIIDELFLTQFERQKEIEKLTEGEYPGFGYAVLAQLITHQKYGRNCNVVLTVNFDDLIADAIYLYTKKKPLVISHDALVGFVKITGIRSTIIKLHGDARLEPKNTKKETKRLPKSVKKILNELLSEMGLIFIGYGGNDESIANFLKELPLDALPWGIYWVGNEIPKTQIGKWLKKKDAIWVKHRDFDELMLLLWNEFELEHPQISKRFNKLEETYHETFKTLMNKIDAKTDKSEKTILENAIEKAVSKFESWWSVYLEANKYKKTDIEKADKIYKAGLKKFPNSHELLNCYAIFLKVIRKEYNKAEVFYKKAIEIDPNYAIALGNYANFLNNIRKEYNKAEEYYKKVIEIDPNYANNLGNYANFLKNIRKEYNKAEEYYKKAIEIDPNYAYALGNYAGFLLSQGKYDEGFNLLHKALDLTEEKTELHIECLFYIFAHTKDNKSRNESLAEIKNLLETGIRSIDWNLEDNVKKAIEDGHLHPEFLEKLSKVISDEIDIKELDKFDIWKKKK